MSKFDTSYSSLSKRQRWLFIMVAVIIFSILFYGFSVAVQNVREQYGSDEQPTLQKTEE